MTDLVYPVKPGDHNEELRYSLRSVHVNAPRQHPDHYRERSDLPAIFGHLPAWLDDNLVAGVTVRQDPHTKPLNAWRNLTTALSTDWLDEDIVIMNDDFYITDPVEQWQPTTPGMLRETIGETAGTMGRYVKAQHATLTFLAGAGIVDPVSYEGHTPFPVKRAELAETLRWMTHRLEAWPAGDIARLLWRTIHGNRVQLPATPYAQAKVSSLELGPPYVTPYLSTNDSTFQRGIVGAWVRERFPDPSPWERP